MSPGDCTTQLWSSSTLSRARCCVPKRARSATVDSVLMAHATATSSKGSASYHLSRSTMLSGELGVDGTPEQLAEMNAQLRQALAEVQCELEAAKSSAKSSAGAGTELATPAGYELEMDAISISKGTRWMAVKSAAHQLVKPLCGCCCCTINEETNSPAGPAQSSAWSISEWLRSLNLLGVVSTALQGQPGVDPYAHVLSFSRKELDRRLKAARIGGLAAPIWLALEDLRGQKVSTSAALKSKFAQEADFEMSYGSVELFFAGLEGLVGAPVMLDGSLLDGMRAEHTLHSKSMVQFTSSNGLTTTPAEEWEFVFDPSTKRDYAERAGLKQKRKKWCRSPVQFEELINRMEAKNVELQRHGHTPLIKEEVVGGRLYTGPCYELYNTVLRAKSGSVYLAEKNASLNGDNVYPTTIHAINSCVIKLSKLTKAAKVYRGFTRAKLPNSFWEPNAFGTRGGIEFAFVSTTIDEEQALHYAEGSASTVFEMQMGMVDRGADISWLSQYPHECEVLLPPLTGIEVLGTRVQGSTLVVEARFSLNLLALTLEQVAGKRKKLLVDMGAQMAAEVRRGVEAECADEAESLVHARLEGPLGEAPEAYNWDLRFQAAVGDALKVKRSVELAAALQHADGLEAAMLAVEPLQGNVVNLSEVDLSKINGPMVGIVVAWMKSNPSALTGLTIDWASLCERVRDALLGLVQRTRTIVALSVGEEGAASLNLLQLNGTDATSEINLSRKGLRSGSAAIVAAGLEVGGALTSLNLCGNELGEQGSVAIATAVEKSRHLKHLDVSSDSSISGDAAQQLASSVLASPTLEVFSHIPLTELRGDSLPKLDLRDKYLGPTEGVVIAELLSKALTDLNLSNRVDKDGKFLISGKGGIGEQGAITIAQALAANELITSLDLGFNNLTEQAAVNIVRVEERRNKLTNLGLAGCSIGPHGAEQIADFVRSNHSMRTLDLSGNDLVADGAITLAKALEVNGMLKSLDVSRNRIKPDGTKAMAAALKVNGVLTSLNVAGPSQNPGDEGTAALAEALKINRVLTSLDLYRGGIGDQGVAAIAEAMEVNNGVLKSVDVSRNGFGDEAAQTLRKLAAKKNITIEV